MTDEERYTKALYAMQSGVAAEMASSLSPGTEPKHLRVGINSAMCDHGALVKLLIDRGFITQDDYFHYLANMMELEVKRYEERLTQHYGKPIILR